MRAEVTISLSQLIDAATAEEALAAAEGLALPRIRQLSEDAEEWQTSGELDGTPKNLTVEEEPEVARD